MEWLSGEPLFAKLGSSSTSQIIDLCRTNTHLNANLCDNEDFWQYRYIAERGNPKVIPASWKRAYLRTTNIYVFDFTSDDDQPRIMSLTFPKSIAEIMMPKGLVRYNPRKFADLVVLTTDGEVYYLDSNYQFKRIPLNETIVQISRTRIISLATKSMEYQFLLLTDNGQVYLLLHDQEAPQLLELPVSIKFIAPFVFLSTENKLYNYYPETQKIEQYRDIQLESVLADNITELDGDFSRIYFKANGQDYRITDNVQQIRRGIIRSPSPIRKIFWDKLALLENGQLWNIYENVPYYEDAPLAQDVANPYPEDTIIILDKLDQVWINRTGGMKAPWVKVDLPTQVTNIGSDAVWWGQDDRPLPTSYAHFSQLVNRGKIPEFKVPAQPGMNEPYVDTFLIPDVEGYQYEVTARYDPQTGQMTAP